MGKGSKSQPQEQQVTTTTSNLPEYARPYFENLVNRAQAESYREYTPYQDQRIAGFTPEQQQVQQGVMGLQTPGQYGTASGLASASGLGSLAASQYNPAQAYSQQINQPNLQNFQMRRADQVATQDYGSPQMQTASTGFSPQLEQYQIGAPDTFGQPEASRYMSPYFQSVLDVQKREAVTDARKAQVNQDLGSVRQGTYGGARQLLSGMERERALGQQLGDIEARGLQSAYENAQSQFERDRAAGMSAEGQNLQAQLQTQQLGTQTGLQSALANLSSAQQANVQNLAAQLQTQGLNADQALRAALANQQANMNVGQQNLQARLGVQQLGAQTGLQALMANQQANLDAQKLAEQSRQFGGNLGLQGLAQANQSAQTLSNIGSTQQQADLSRLAAQGNTAAQQQLLQQQQMDMSYADFLRQRDYPMEQLGYYSNLLRGLPVGLSSTQTSYGQPPSVAAQLGGVGLGATALSQMARG
jgi:hypothetical protein